MAGKSAAPDLKQLPNIEKCRKKFQRKLKRFDILVQASPLFSHSDSAMHLQDQCSGDRAKSNTLTATGSIVFLCLLALVTGWNFEILLSTFDDLSHSFSEELPLTKLFVITLVFAFSGFVKGVSGVGMALIAVPVVSMIYTPALAVLLVSVPLVVTNFHQGITSCDVRQTLRSHSLLTIVMTMVMTITAFFSYLISPMLIELTIGLSAIVFVLCHFKFRFPAIPDRYDRAAQFVTGCIAGLVGGVTGLIAIPLVCYMLLRNIQKEQFIAVSGLLFLMSGVALLIGYFLNDVLTLKLFVLSSLVAAPAMIGTLLGEYARKHMSQPLFRKLVLFLIFAIGVKTLL